MAMIRSIENGKRKRGELHHDDRDRINKLPDEILISIISRLTLREAIATRILSTRWRYLCTNEYATHLNFPPFNLSNCEGMLMRRRFGNYVNMMNQIVDSHKAPKLKEFSVRMLSMEGASLEKWLVFALSKHVEIIDINMDYLANACCVVYSFQVLRYITMQLPLGLRSLKKLSLSAINVEDSEIELLLSNSPQLESLSIAMPGRLTRVSVSGQPTFMLKHLEICHAPDLKLVEIVNMINLVSIRLYNLAAKLVNLALNNVPILVQFSTTCSVQKVFTRVAPSILTQLHTLKICWNGKHPLSRDIIPMFKGVKHLELRTDLSDHGLWELFAVIQRCPSLEELVIKLLCEFIKTNFQEVEADEMWLPKGEYLFPSLKKMKLCNFVGCTEELNLLISIVNNANSLEELTVHVCDATEEIRLARALQHIRPTLQESTRLQVI